MRVCRICRVPKELTAFKLMHDGEKFYRRKSCDLCASVRNGTYPEIRARELALIPNPFEKRNVVQIQDQSHLLWADCV